MKLFFKLILLISFVFLGKSGNLYAQYKYSNPANKKAKKYYKKAIKNYRSGKFDNAIKYFEKTLNYETGFIPVYYRLATIYFKKNDFEKTEYYYKKALEIDSSYNLQVYYSLAVIMEKQGKLEEALSYYKAFVKKSNIKGELEKKAKKKIKNLPFIIYAKKHPVPFEPQNVGKAINTQNNEYLPVLTGDNTMMIFTRKVDRQEDFYISKMKDGKWTKAEPLYELNTLENEGAHTLTPDGKTMIFTVCDRRRTLGSCDLMISKKINGKWTKASNLGHVINTHFWESQPSISADGKVLYFASNRPGCVGGKDIWYSTKDIKGNWTKPVCLDTMINTPADDKAPYIHPDNSTLYFTSSGHTGMGGLDIFMSKKINGKWTKAKNLGFPINTENDEGALFVTLDGKKAYFSTDRNTGANKNLDIYFFETGKSIRPQEVTYVKGVVFDIDTHEKLPATIFVYDNSTGKKLFEVSTDRDSFLLPLVVGKDYNFSVEKKGYAFYSERFAMVDTCNTGKPYILGIGLSKINTEKKSSPVVLNNIFFEYNSAVLDTLKSKIELNKLIALLRNNPGIKIRISGHTDNKGSAEYNMKLSKERAKAVYDFLIGKNIDKNRLEYTGYGQTRPIDSNKTEKGRRRNRRTEFEIKPFSNQGNKN